MSNIGKATGTAGTCNIGGKVCLMSRLKIKDIAQWEQYVLDELKNAPNPFDRIMESMKGLSGVDKRTVLKIAYDNAYSMDSMDCPQAKKIIDSKESHAFMVWLSARRENPDVTLEQTMEAIGEMEHRELADMIENISGMGGKPKGKDGEENEKP